MNESVARTLGILGLVLVILTIPVYFIDLLAVSPAVDHCPAQPGDNRSIVLWVFLGGVALWVVGVVFSGIAITQRASRAVGIAGAIVALLVPFGALLGLYLLLGGDCFAPSEGMQGLGLLV